MRELEGKVAVITGAGSGLGRAYAKLFAAEGAGVVVNDYNLTVDGAPMGGPSLAEQVVAEIQAAGGAAVACNADVSTEAGGQAILQAALDRFGRVDILVNNAGIVRDADFCDMTLAQWDGVIAVHLRGAFCVTQPIFRQMVVQGQGGVIVNTTSRTGLRGRARQANYGAAKAGLVGLSGVLAVEGRPHGIRTWTISPRAATRAWDFHGVVTGGQVTDELRERFGMEAIAQALLYMVSDRSRPHSGRIVFASAESLREVRWEPADAFTPTAAPTLADIEHAVAQGRLLFADEADSERIS